MKASCVFRSPLFVKGADIGTTKTLAEADLNKCHQVTAGVVVTIPTPLTMKAQAGDMVMLFNSSAAGASVALGAGASFLNHSGSVPLTPGVAVLLVAYSDSAWTIQGIVPATQADIVAGTDVKKFINPKEHLSFHQADITKLAGIAAGANLYVHPNHSGDVTSVADGAQTIAANAVTNLKLADMANATIKGRVTAGAGDPEDLTAAQARSILNVADGAQKNSNITKAEIEAKLTGTIASHDHGVTGLPLTGGTLTGNLTISKDAPTIVFEDTGETTRKVHCNSNRIGFLSDSGAWTFYSNNDGTNTSIGILVVGSATFGTDGNIYMPWAGDYLSNILPNRVTKDMTVNVVGSYALCLRAATTEPLSPNGLYDGGALYWCGFTKDASSSDLDIYLWSDPIYGTWRCLGQNGNTEKRMKGSLFQRVA